MVQSLQTRGRFSGQVIVCDNGVGGKWNSPEPIATLHTFFNEQLEYLRSCDVKVLGLEELLSNSTTTIEALNAIPTAHFAYPLKLFYCLEIAARYADKEGRVLFLDCDTYFQKPVASIFDFVRRGHISMGAELLLLGQNEYMHNELNAVRLGDSDLPDAILSELRTARNYCSGVIAAETPDFIAFMKQALDLAASPRADFRSDQVLINLQIQAYNTAIAELPISEVMHLGDIPGSSLGFSHKTKTFHYLSKIIPALVHFNGDRKGLEQCISDPANEGTIDSFDLPSAKRRFSLSNSLRKLRDYIGLSKIARRRTKNTA